MLITFSIIRSANTGITFDEAYTYLTSVYRNPFKVFLSLFADSYLANNHILNSFCMSVIKLIIPINYNEFLIRLPNIIFYILYLIYSYKLSNKYQSKVKYLLYGLLVLNYGVQEYSGLARGYGMACSCMLVSVYYFKSFIDTKKFSSLNISILCSVASCYANTVSLLGFAPLLILTTIFIIKERLLKDYLKNILNILFLLVIGTLTLIIIRYHFMISSDGLPLYGGTGSFFKEVIVSFANEYGFNEYSMIIMIALLLLLFIILLTNFKEINKIIKSYVGVFFILYLILLVSLTILTKKMWLTGRCLIPATPFFALMIVEIIDIVKIEKIKNIVVYIILLFLLTSFCLNLNLNKTRFWNDDYIIKTKAYKAYRDKDKSIMEPYLDSIVTTFYKEKIQYYYHYDIY